MPCNLCSNVVLPIAIVSEDGEFGLHCNWLSPHVDAGLQAILDALLADQHDGCALYKRAIAFQRRICTVAKAKRIMQWKGLRKLAS